MEAQRAKREEDRIKRLEDEEVSLLTFKQQFDYPTATIQFSKNKAISFETVVKREKC